MNISGILKKSLASALLAAGFSLAAASSIFTADQVELIPDRVGSDANDTVEELKMPPALRPAAGRQPAQPDPVPDRLQR